MLLICGWNIHRFQELGGKNFRKHNLTIKIKGIFIMVYLNLSYAADGQSAQSVGGANSRTRHKTGEDGDWRDCLLRGASTRLSWA